jgi:predicted peptidase
MNVLAMVRKEFNVDARRIYLTGHTMGGAGTYFLGSKHADIWAAIAPVAPAAFGMNADRVRYLQPLKDAGVPTMVVHGDKDEAVPVETSRDNWVPSMNELGIQHEYVELPGVTHGPVITQSQQYIYAFFDKHSKRSK